MQRLAKEVKADENMLRFVVINGLKPEICNHVTRTQPTTWNDLVYHARIGEMSAPETPPLDLTLAVKLEAIQDQLHQLTKVRSVSPVYVAGHSESRCVSSRSDSHPGSPKRVRFDLSLDQGEQEYRYSQDDFRDDHHTRSEERQSFDDWDNEGRSQQQNAGPPNHEFRGRNRFSDSQGRGFSQRQRHSTYGSPQNYGPQNCGQMPYGQPTYGPHQNFGPQNFIQHRRIMAPRFLHTHTCRCSSQLMPRHLPIRRRDGTLDKGQALHRRHSVSNVQNDG